MPPSRDDLVALVADPARYLDHPDPTLRRIAVTSLDADQAIDHVQALRALVVDTEPAVRAAAAEQLGRCGDAALDVLEGLRSDVDAVVREAVATAYGEIGSSSALGWLVEAAADEDRHVREAAVASLGAIGDAAAIDALLEFVATGPPQVRRRAIAAITVFEDPRIEPAIRMAALDRNPAVREAAEMVVGRQIVEVQPD